jgi:hypothetical protein
MRRRRGHGLHYLTGAGASTTGHLTVEAIQTELKERFEWEGAGEPDSHPSAIACDDCTDLEQFEPDGANLGTR